MKCFYHSADLDGHCSGAIIKHAYPDCELIGINYGDDFPWYDIQTGETVYMVDFSLQPFGDMVRLDSIADLVWIDHHISAIKASEDADKVSVAGYRRDGMGACFWAWEYTHTEPVPQAVRLLAEYDVRDHHDPRTLPFQYGLRSADTIPENNMALWISLFEDNEQVVSWVNKGTTILLYVLQDNTKYCSACAFDTELSGLRCVAVNKMLTNSQVFESVWDSEKYDAMLTFGWRKGKWTVSIYTDRVDVDVSTIAKAYGGGGHKQAAGFQCTVLPFELG